VRCSEVLTPATWRAINAHPAVTNHNKYWLAANR